MKQSPQRWFVLLLALLFYVPTFAQFGQNKISYENFDWHVYESPHFDIHYYPSQEPFLEDIVSYVESAYLKISKDLDHELRFRVPLVIYKTHGEFGQTNITLSEVPEGVAAFAEPVQYRMVLPIDGAPDKLQKLISHELVHIFEYSIFYEGYLGRALRSNPPTWIMEGLASYLADDEDNLDRMAIRDAVVNNVLPPLQALNVVTYLTYRYGHAVFDFIEQEHGIEGLRSFLFEFKKVLLSGNIDRAIRESFGYDIDEFNRRFNRYLRKKYFPVLLEKKAPDEYGTEIGQRRNPVTLSPALSPSGELIAALAAPKQELDLVIISAEDSKIQRNLTKGWTSRYKNLVANAFEGKRDLSWAPDSDRIAVFARKENRWPLLIFNALNGKMLHNIDLDDIFECSSPAFSPDGRRIAFEGNRNGVVDLFEYNLDTGAIVNLTQDDFFDANPWYSTDGSSLLYNRRIGEHWKIFAVDLADSSKKTQLTFGVHSDLQPSYTRDGTSILFSSDRGGYGVFNVHTLDLATGDVSQYTDVVGGTFGPVEMSPRDDDRFIVFNAYFEGRFRLYRMPLNAPELVTAASDRLSADDEAEPFVPELQLSVDENKKAPYKLKWDLEAPGFGVGVTGDGTFLADATIQFTDLLGNHRISIGAQSVANFASYNATYVNRRNRYNWGGQVYDFRDFFVDQSTGERIERQYSQTGATAFIQYPVSRHFRVETSGGYLNASLNRLAQNSMTGQFGFIEQDDSFAMVEAAITHDTARYQGFGPFQGQRFRLDVRQGFHLSGDSDGDLTEFRLDYRRYKQLTRRTLLALRLATIYNTGDNEYTYGFGGLNQLRGWEYREFFGSRLAFANFEYRFPLIDELRFPFLALQQIRGMAFFDVGAAWFPDDLYYDPDLRMIRADLTQTPIPFDFWDSENDQFQDARASYGFGFQFLFIGNLQFNWIWAKRLDFTQYCASGVIDACVFDGLTPLEKRDGDTRGTRMEFYITYDF
ncbi:MAG: hypothetical protein OEV00_09620 [Acidobacteriota bacterium]|nr:hypothetical protein [Acidobacteriota bacterium]MDH3785570.1 hypothetical protein [Acidobacteriota bacterium]